MSLNKLPAEYPEHLNPFHGSRNSLRQSFRGFKRAIVKSFTGKDKEKPVIRPKPVSQQSSPTYIPVQHRHTESEIVFPRSRFSERVSKTEAARSPSINRKTVPATSGINPFDGEDEKSNTKNTTLPPKPAERTKLKRRKKRAPIPPDSVNGGGQYLSPSVNGSKWSLVSTESEMSSMCYSESEVEHVDIKDTDRQDEILKITQEIARFAQDTNNNSIVDKELDNAKSDKVDGTKIEVRISPADDEECVDHENNLTNQNDSVRTDKLENDIKQPSKDELKESNTKLEISEKADVEINGLKEPNSQTETDRDSHGQATQNVNEELNKIIVKESEEGNYIIKESNFQTEMDKDSHGQVTQNSNEELSKIIVKESEENNYTIKESNSQTLIDKDSNGQETQNVNEELNNIVINESEGDNYTLNTENYDSTISNQRKQSWEETETVELRPHNIEEFPLSENRFSVKGKIEYFEYTYASPTPKIRKNILTKEKLLGSEESV